MKEKIPFWCRIGFHKRERMEHPTNWYWCKRCGHVIIGKVDL